MKKALCLVLACSVIAAPLDAAEVDRIHGAASALAQTTGALVHPMPQSSCVRLSISFNIGAKSLAEARSKFDEKLNQVNDLAKQQGIQRLDIESLNYNVFHQVYYLRNAPAESPYKLNGSVSYGIESRGGAFKLGEILAKQELKVNLTTNDRRAGCDDPRDKAQ